MRIVHLTDLHYGKKYEDRINKMLPILLSELESIRSEKGIDLIIFSGDLVFSGNKIQNFHDVLQSFFVPICKSCCIEMDKLIFCQGNHDMNTQLEMKAITEYIDRIDNIDNLDYFVTQDESQFLLSFINSENYYSFVKEIYPNDTVDRLYQVFERTIGNIVVGLVSINSAWRSFIGDHSGKLLVPKAIINSAIKQTKHCDIKIFSMHHPLEDLKVFNKYEIEDLVYENFHISFSGHYHKKKQNMFLSSDIGMLSLSSSATMSGDDGSAIGFSLLDIDAETYEVELNNYTYISAESVFSKTSQYKLDIPLNSEKKIQSDLLKEMRRNANTSLLEANDLLILQKEELEDNDFLKLFSELVIKDISATEMTEKKLNANSLKLDDLVENNIIVFGKNKSGKTSLLRKIQISLYEDFKSLKTIPIYLDLNDANSIQFETTNFIRKTFNLTKKEATKLNDTYKVKFLIDNLDIDNINQIDQLIGFESKTPFCSFLITSDESSSSTFVDIKINNKSLQKVFLHPISRNNIRNQTNKFLTHFSEDERQVVINKVIDLFSQMNIPFNYWSLSIFLWLYKRDKKLLVNDSIELLILYVDKLLGREHIASLGKNFEYEMFVKLLSQLSFELTTIHELQNYSISYLDLVDFIEKFKKENIRFVSDSKATIDYLLNQGVLKKANDSGLYTFRLNGVMEYFTALFMSRKKTYAYELIDDDSKYLSYSNEFEILAGLERDDSGLLKKIYMKTKTNLKHINVKFEGRNNFVIEIDENKSKLLAQRLSNLNFEDNSPLSFEDQDILFDDITPIQSFNEDVKRKAKVEYEKGFSHSQLEKHVLILGRVYREMFMVNDVKLLKEVFDFIIDTSINLGYELFYELEGIGKKPKKEIESFLLDFFSNLIPLLVEGFLSDVILHSSIKRLIEEKILELEKDVIQNQYKLLLLYLLLLDLDLKENKGILTKLIKNIQHVNLKTVTMLKLYYYLLFKCNNNKNLQELIRDSIIKLRLSIDPSINSGTLKQDIDRFILKSNKISLR